MKLSTRGHYAITAMMELALKDKQPITLADISEVQHISVSYLEQIFANLRKNGLVKGTRGPGGGYCLSRSPENITIAEIIAGVEEDLDTTLYAGRAHRINIKRSETEPLWQHLSGQIYNFLNGITLDYYIKMAKNSDITHSNNCLEAA